MSNAHVGGFGPGPRGRAEEKARRRQLGAQHFTVRPAGKMFRSSLHTALWLIIVVLQSPTVSVDHE